MNAGEEAQPRRRSDENVGRITALAKDADILVIEACFAADESERAADRRHLTTAQAGTLGRLAGVRRLEPFHFSPRRAASSDELRPCRLRALIHDGRRRSAPEAAREHYEAAARYAEQGALRAAVIELKNALQRDPDNAEARLLLGEVYVQLGEGASAEKELRAAARLGHESSRIAVPLGQALLLQGRFDQVLAELATEEVPPEIASEILLLRAVAHAGLGQAEAARAIYDEVTAKSPDEHRAYLGRARLALAAGDLPAAEAEAGEALAQRPAAVEALLVQAEARRLGGRPEEALAPFRAALDSTPSAPGGRTCARRVRAGAVPLWYCRLCGRRAGDVPNLARAASECSAPESAGA